jgi:biopolymer transport protein ExbD
MHADTRPIAAINVTPLVDVMLVLLVIFMLATPSLTQRLVLTLPTRLPPERMPPPPPEPPLQLRIAADGRIALDGQPLPDAVFAAEIAHRAAGGKALAVEIDADQAVAYAHVVEVLGTLREQGIARVGFVDRGR